MLNFFANLRLSFKIFIPVALLVAVAAFIGYDAQKGLKNINTESDEITQVTSQRMINILQIESNLSAAVVSEKNILLAIDADTITRNEKDYHAKVKEAVEAAEKLILLSDTPERKEMNTKIRNQLVEFDTVTKRVINLARSGQMELAAELSRTQGRNIRIQIEDFADKRITNNAHEMDQNIKDIDEVIDHTISEILYVSIIGISFSLLLLYLMVRFMVVRPIISTTDAMKSVADGNLDTEIKGAERKDEVGKLAQALLIFKENALETRRLTAEQERMKAQAAADQKAALNKMADEFEQSVGGVVTLVASSATEMQHSAQTLSASAEETNQQAAAVSAATTQTSANVQIVAASAEELSASINEISQQVQQSNKATLEAVDQVRKTTATMSELSEVAQNIGQVVDLIRDIADQTNLLALNATIEAARAGDAGKGFAVVAGEVKALASQTASATNEIAKRITDIQNAANDATRAIDLIGTSIDNVNQISGVIASAVVEQQAATNEIAGNVQQASAGVDEVSANMTGVTQASGEVGSASTQMLGAAQELAVQADKLRTEVSQFLSTVRAA